VAANPPTIVLFTNGPELFDNTYQRYLLKAFRDHLPFTEVPIKMYLRRKRSADKVPDLVEAPAPKGKKDTVKPRHGRSDSDLWEDL
jgi:hypothetical protein